MPAFYKSTLSEFLSEKEGVLLARLALAYANDGFTQQYTDQILTWERDLNSLRRVLLDCVMFHPAAEDWGVIIEFAIPRKELRIDVVLLIGRAIVLLEAKSGDAGPQAARQLEEYALLLHYFHKASDLKFIFPVLVSGRLEEQRSSGPLQRSLGTNTSAHWIRPVARQGWNSLAPFLVGLIQDAGPQVGVEDWEASPYHPVPSILEAACALRTGLKIPEIAHSEASEHEVSAVVQFIEGCVQNCTRKPSTPYLLRNWRSRFG